MTPEQEDEVRDLKDLLASPGWRRFVALVDGTHGPDATLQAIERTVGAVALGDQAAVHDATQHVLSASKAARGVVLLPTERIAHLTGQQVARKPFAAWRRA